MKKNESVKLGLMPPLTGLVSLYGPEISWAATIACNEINERGGLLGRPLRLIIEDDGSLPETAVPAANKLVDEHGCVAIIGNLLSNSRIAVADRVALAKKVPYLNFSFYEGSIWNRYFFNFAALPNQQIEKMIPFMMKEFGPKMYFAGSNYEWPRGSIDAAKRILLRIGGEIVGEKYLPIGSSNTDALLESVAKSGADVFVPYFAGEDQINLLTKFSQRGLKSRMAVVMGHYDEAMVGSLSPQVREGFYSTNTYFMGIDTPENAKYLERLSKLPDVTGVWPNGNGVLTNFGEGTYNCVHAFAKAVQQAGSLDVEEIVEALRQISIVGPQGRIDMDPMTHHAKVNTYLAKCCADGTFKVIESFGRTDPVIPDRYKRTTPEWRALEDKPSGNVMLFPSVREKELSVDMLSGAGTSNNILERADISILSVNEKGDIIQANQAASALFGYSMDELKTLTIHQLVPPYLQETHKVHFARFLQSDKMKLEMGQRADVRGYRQDGSEFPAEISVAKFKEDGNWVVVATLRDITARKNREEELLWQATHDLLTNLPNRTMMQERLSQALKRTQRNEDELALLFIDLDGFKLINDSYGHKTGDSLLVAIAERLVDIVRPGDTVARFGGDEFVILCERIRDINTVAEIAERIMHALRQPLIIDDISMYATASLGVAVGNGHTHEGDELLRNADAAMYSAKDQGRDGWEVFDSDIHEAARERLVIGNGLRTAISNNELKVLFQPIINVQSQQIIAAEMLLRWHPSEKMISPDKFIPIAESNGTIVPIGAWVYEQACLAQRALDSLSEEKRPRYISVNVSARQLGNAALLATFEAILRQTGADPKRIVIEITETALMSDTSENVKVLQRISELGHRIAVDDFGTGYSSLSRLVNMPVSTLKIDRDFIEGMEKNKKSETLVAAIFMMACALGYDVIAEGMETEAQLNILQKMGCDNVQGYYFYKPMPFDTFVDLLQDDHGGIVLGNAG